MTTRLRVARQQAGATLIEVLLVVVISALIAGPLTMWAIATLDHQSSGQRLLANAVGTGMLNAHLQRDVAAAQDVFWGTGGDCAGGGAAAGGGAGPVRMALVSGGDAPVKVVYKEAAASTSTSERPATSLWRRQCNTDGTIGEAEEVFERVVPGSVELTCPGGPPAPGECAPSVRRVRTSLTPEGPSSPAPVELHATRRVSVPPDPSNASANRAPIAIVDVTPLVATAGTTFSVRSTGSRDPDGDPLTHEWEVIHGDVTESVGGGASSFGLTLDEVGDHTILLKLTDDQGATSTAVQTVRVTNRAPIARAVVDPAIGAPDDEFEFRATGSTDPDGDAIDVEWDFGSLDVPSAQLDDAVVRARFDGARPASYQVSLSVRDEHGAVDRTFLTVDLRGQPGDIEISPTPVERAGHLARVGSVGPDLPPLEVTFAVVDGGGGVEFDWLLYREGSDEPIVSSGAAELVHEFEYGDAGEYLIVRQTAEGPFGAPVRFRVNAAPTASFSFTAGAAGSPSQFRGGASTDDGRVASWRWDFGDGADEASGRDAEHTYDAPGAYTVRLTVTDDDGTSHVTEREVRVIGTIAAPPPPRWQGPTLLWDPIEPAQQYRVEIWCGASRVQRTDLDAPATSLPVTATCTGLAATLAVRINQVWSAPSERTAAP